MINTRSIEKLNILLGTIQFLMMQNILEEEKQVKECRNGKRNAINTTRAGSGV
jgi:hypothetical protein